jgi:hypothetical protein
MFQKRLSIIHFILIIIFITTLACDVGLNGPNEVTVVYRVTGSTPIVKDIEYRIPGTSNYVTLHNVNIPWSKKLSAREGQYVYLRAFKEDSTTTMTISILKNGKVYESTTITRYGGDTVADILR